MELISQNCPVRGMRMPTVQQLELKRLQVLRSPDTVETMGSSSLVAPSRTERVVIDETLVQVFGVACGMSLTEVGRTFACDRTTVSHACGVVEDGRDDPTFDRVLDLLE